MPAKSGNREQVFVDLFVSAYENFAWAGSKIDRLDEKKDSAVEALVTRPDGYTMAIEHTLIQPFFNEVSDLVKFEPAFQRIKDDKSLAVPYTGIKVFIPAGILDGKKQMQGIIVSTIHEWITKNRLHLREGEHKYQCEISGMSPVTLTINRIKNNIPKGYFLLGRQQVTNDLDRVIANP